MKTCPKQGDRYFPKPGDPCPNCKTPLEDIGVYLNCADCGYRWHMRDSISDEDIIKWLSGEGLVINGWVRLEIKRRYENMLEKIKQLSEKEK